MSFDFANLPPEQLKEARERLADPRFSLPTYGKVLDMATDTAVQYDPDRIAKKIQRTILSYAGAPPENDHGQYRWLVLLTSRQAGKSTATAMASYALCGYTPGADHLCLADTKDRANYLHGRVVFTHEHWPKAVRSPTTNRKETRQLTFDPNARLGGKMRTASLETNAVGVGASPAFLHWSEVGLCDNTEEQWSMLRPAMTNRNNSRAIFECTPTLAGMAGTDFWKGMVDDAKKGGRYVYAFFPYWDTILNRRKWNKGDRLDSVEEKLMEKFGPKGMKLENIAFRRSAMDEDREIRRNPDLFDVFYPKDDISCWVGASSGVIPRASLQRHIDSILIPWAQYDVYKEYKEPREGAIYAIGADPAGFGARDHASFQVLELWDGEWTQVATYAGVTDPVEFPKKLMAAGKRYNNAAIGVERNGVGAGTLVALETAGYTNIFYEKMGSPGIWTSAQSLDKMTTHLVDALMDELTIYDEDLVNQFLSYRHDKRTEDGVNTEILRGGGTGRRRRDRHHWDKVSAMLMAVAVARTLPQRVKPGAIPKASENVVMYQDMTWDKVRAFEVKSRQAKKGKAGRPKLKKTKYRRRK